MTIGFKVEGAKQEIYMPIIYGQTKFSILTDIRVALSQYISEGECLLIGKACTSLWKTRYHEMDCLIHLISDIGWIASASNRPVMYMVSSTARLYRIIIKQDELRYGYMTDPIGRREAWVGLNRRRPKVFFIGNFVVCVLSSSFAKSSFFSASRLAILRSS